MENAGLQGDSPFCDVLSLESNTQIPTSHASFLPWHPEVSNVTLGCPKQNTEPVEVPKLQITKMHNQSGIMDWAQDGGMSSLGNLRIQGSNVDPEARMQVLWVGGNAGSRWMLLVSSPTHILMVSF